MDHLCYLDEKSHEYKKLIEGSQLIIMRAFSIKKVPYESVFSGDTIYFIKNNGEGKVIATANVVNVYNSPKMEEEKSIDLIDKYQYKLQLSVQQYKKWAGKRYVVLIEIDKVEKVEPFFIDKRECGKMGDWAPIINIKRIIRS